MNPQNVVANNDEKMTPVGRMGVSTRYDSKNDRYVRTNKQYKKIFKRQTNQRFKCIPK